MVIRRWSRRLSTGECDDGKEEMIQHSNGHELRLKNVRDYAVDFAWNDRAMTAAPKPQLPVFQPDCFETRDTSEAHKEFEAKSDDLGLENRLVAPNMI